MMHIAVDAPLLYCMHRPSRDEVCKGDVREKATGNHRVTIGSE